LRKYIIHIIPLLLSACIKEIPYDSDTNTPSMPAVHCFITPDSVLTADCRLTAPFGRKDIPIAGAGFYILKSGKKSDSSLYTGNGIHRFATNSVKAGDTFVFSGNIAGFNAFEIPCIAPREIFIQQFDTTRLLVPGIGRAFSIELKFNDDAIFENFYRCYMYKSAYQYIYDNNGKISDSTLKRELIALFSDNQAAVENTFNNYTSREIIFSDATFNGVKQNMVFYTSDPLVKTNGERPVGIEFYLENISKSLFDFYNTRNAHIWQQQSISQLPGKIVGNVPGAFGVVGAYTTNSRYVMLKR
jgi:hypothetical protein